MFKNHRKCQQCLTMMVMNRIYTQRISILSRFGKSPSDNQSQCASSFYYSMIFHSFLNIIALVLSWYRMLSATLNPCILIKSHTQNICDIKSSTPTCSLSVELQVFSFCFVDATKGNTVPRVKAPTSMPSHTHRPIVLL